MWSTTYSVVMRTRQPDAGPLLSIGELAGRTGVPVSTLRSWEQRLGFPASERSSGGQRRYRAEDAELVARVLAERGRGRGLAAAVDMVLRQPRVGSQSLFAQLRDRHPGLDVLTVGMRTMRALTWAIEDECLAHASRPVLFGGFQDQRGFARAGRRWRELARAARGAVVLADFAETDPDASPARVALPTDSPMLNEWSVTCLDPQLAVTLAAWERPRVDGPRRFEAVLTLQPEVVLDAARLCASTAEACGLAGAVSLVEQHATAPPEDARRTASLLRRFALYADA